VTDAELDPPMGPNEPILDPDYDNTSPRACIAASEEIHQDLFLLGVDIDNQIVITSMHDAALIAFRDDVFIEAEGRCDMLADTQSPGSTNDCTSILIDDTFPIQYAASQMCMGEYQPPIDNWWDHYELEEVIELNPTNGAYSIDAEFFDAMIYNPWWLMGDSAYIARNGNSDFAFFNVQSGDVVDALGIESGDVPQTLNAFDVTSILEVSLAYLQLWQATEFELVVNRPGVGTVTLDYEVVP
jgi:hypothetical protein